MTTRSGHTAVSLAAISLALALVFPPVGLALALMARDRVEAGNRPDRIFTIVGIVVNAVALGVFVLLMLYMVFVLVVLVCMSLGIIPLL